MGHNLYPLKALKTELGNREMGFWNDLGWLTKIDWNKFKYKIVENKKRNQKSF